MELLSSAAVALASSWEAEPEPFDREASQILVGARLLVAGDDPVATDGLVGHLRAHGASVGVTDARGEATVRIGIPPTNALLHSTFGHQALSVAPSTNQLGLLTSNAMRIRVGGDPR